MVIIINLFFLYYKYIIQYRMPLLAAAIIGGAILLSGSENESTMKNKVTTNVTNNFMQKMSFLTM